MTKSKLFGVDAPPARDKLRVEIKEALLSELNELLEFMREHEGHHVELTHAVEYIIEEYFSSKRKEVKAFGEWKEKRKGNDVEDAQSVDSKAGQKVPAKEREELPTKNVKEDLPNQPPGSRIAGVTGQPTSRVLER